MSVRMIWAQNLDGYIGLENQLLFRLRGDMAHFSRLTTGAIVLMGRKTWESLPNGPLPNRYNVILTRDPHFHVDPAYDMSTEVISDMKSFLDLNASKSHIWIIGGEQVYRQALQYCSELVVTEVLSSGLGDAKAPEIDEDEFRLVALSANHIEVCQLTKQTLVYRFKVYRRKAYYFKTRRASNRKST